MKTTYLYHGSANEIIGEKLIPKQAEDLENNPDNLHNAVYATSNKEIAISMAIISSRGVYNSQLRKVKPYGIIYSGKPSQKYIYLYHLNKKEFEEQKGNSLGQWISKKPVKPLKVEKLKIKDYRELVRNATKSEKGTWMKKYGEIKIPKILQQGAEAIIIKQKSFILKKRISKSYRIKELDEKIRKLRTRSEAKLLSKASSIILTPHVIKSDEKTKNIEMEFIDGKKLSRSLDNFPLSKQKSICKQIGKNIAKLHENNIIHGDLTTSNMILKNDKVYFIDFGLGYISTKYEDRAVDLHLLSQALEAKHFQHWKILLKEVFAGYKIYKESKQVFERLKKVEKRGRYRY